jgi:hypothetical protein
MFDKIALVILGTNVLLSMCLYVEFSSLPSLSNTFLVITNNSLSYPCTCLLLVLVLFVIPMIAFVYILSRLKKFIFNHSKNVAHCYTNALHILLISYSLICLFAILSFFKDLAYEKNYYFRVRLSDYTLHTHLPHIFTTNLLLCLVTQSSCFIVAFLVTEILLTYKFAVTTISFWDFMIKNLKTACITFLMILVNVSISVFFENNIYNFSQGQYTRTFRILDRLIEGVLTNSLLMYLYTVFTLHIN